MTIAKQLVEALKDFKQPVTIEDLTAAMMQFCITKNALPGSIQKSVREAIQLGWIQKTTSRFYVICSDEHKNTEKKARVAKPIDALTPPGVSRMNDFSVPNWRKYARNGLIKTKKRRTEEHVAPKNIADARLDDVGACASSQGTSAIGMTYGEIVMEGMFCKQLPAENVVDAFLDAEDRDSIPSACESSTGNIPDNVPVAAHPMNTVFRGPEKTAKGGQKVLPKSQKKPRGNKAVEPLMIMDVHLGDESESTTSDDISYTDLVMEGMLWQKLRRKNAMDVHLDDEGASVSAQSTASSSVQIANPCVSPPATMAVDVPVAAQPMAEVFTGPTETAQVNSQDKHRTLPKPPKKQCRNDVPKNKAKAKLCAKQYVKSRKIRYAHSDGLEQPKNNNFPFVNKFMGLLRALKIMGPEENAQGTSQHSQRKAKHGKAAPKKKYAKGPQKKKR